MKTNKLYFVSCFPAFLILISSSLADPVVIGSKKFTESYVLGEIAKRTLNDAGIPAEHRQGMGGTVIVWQALRGAQIDAYPEYTGTIAEEILKDQQLHSAAAIRDALSKFGVGMTEPLGFNNTYALIMRRDRAQELGIRTISDLQKHPELKIGLTHEFLARQDGWQPLAARYRLSPQSVIGIDHGLGYAALQNGSIDVKDAYSTDAKIAEYDLVVLEDDVGFFPKYEAVFLFRTSMRKDAIAALRKLGGTLDEARMIQLNAEAGNQRWRTVLAQTWALDPAASAACRFLVATRNSRWYSAWHLCESRRRDWSRYSWLCQHCANHSLARFARAARSPSFFRNQRAHCHCRAFPLRIAPNCAQHRERLAGHSAIAARISHCAGTHTGNATLANLSADVVALDFVGN